MTTVRGYNRRWLTTSELLACRKRWAAQSVQAALPEAVTDGMAYQCGGCRFYAALDNDYGLCCNKASPQDGRVVFQSGGCAQHSTVTELDTGDKP